MKAIVITYAECQNCPSKPKSDLVDVPDGGSEREAMLTKLFHEVAYNDESANLTFNYQPNEFGDITVAAVDDGVYMYLTFVTC